MLSAGEISYKKSLIPIVRVDINKAKNFAWKEKISFKDVPKLFLFLKGKYYEYDGEFRVEPFLSFINRCLYPVVILKTIEELSRFLNVSMEWDENTPFYVKGFQDVKTNFINLNKVTRVVALEMDKDEADELKSSALYLSKFLNI